MEEQLKHFQKVVDVVYRPYRKICVIAVQGGQARELLFSDTVFCKKEKTDNFIELSF